MTPEEHTSRHRELHKMLDELMSDYVRNHSNLPELLVILDMPVGKLVSWSQSQTIMPDEPPGGEKHLVAR